MKKTITSIILLLIAVATKAQISNINQLSNSSAYTITKANSGTIYYDGSSTNVMYNASVAENDNSLWAIYKSEKGFTYIYNLGAKKFLVSSTSTSVLQDAAKPITIESAKESSNTFFLYDDDNILGYQSTNTGGDIMFETDYEEFASNQFTLKPSSTRSISQNEQDEILAAINNVEVTTNTAVGGFKTTLLNADGTFPSDATWYSMTIGDYFAFYDKGNTSGELQSQSSQFALNDDRFWWCIVGNETTGYKIYNKSTASQPLSMESSATYDGANINLGTIGTYFSFESNGSNQITIKNFDNNAYLNRYYGGTNTTIKYYSGGSTVVISSMLSQIITYAENIPIVIGEEYVGGYINNDFTQALDYAYTAYKNNTNTTTENNLISASLALLSSKSKIELAPTTNYYRIVQLDENKAMTDDNSYAYRVAINETDNAQLWKLESSNMNGQYYLRNVKTGAYLQNQPTANVNFRTDNSRSTTFTLSERPEHLGYFNITPVGGSSLHGQPGRNNILPWSYSNSSAVSQWTLTPVEGLDITIYDDMPYATICLPFNAILPEGITAYTGLDNGSTISLTKVGEDANVILPAQTDYDPRGLLLKGDEPGIYPFVSTSTPTSIDISDNCLLGTLEAQTSLGNVLVLSFENNQAGFYSWNGAMPPFRAYMAQSNSSKGFDFNTVTNISSAQTTELDTNIFDLSGRKINKVQKGIYIQNGKKVIFK